MKDKIQYFSL